MKALTAAALLLAGALVAPVSFSQEVEREEEGRGVVIEYRRPVRVTRNCEATRGRELIVRIKGKNLDEAFPICAEGCLYALAQGERAYRADRNSQARTEVIARVVAQGTPCGQ